MEAGKKRFIAIMLTIILIFVFTAPKQRLIENTSGISGNTATLTDAVENTDAGGSPGAVTDSDESIIEEADKSNTDIKKNAKRLSKSVGAFNADTPSNQGDEKSEDSDIQNSGMTDESEEKEDPENLSLSSEELDNLGDGNVITIKLDIKVDGNSDASDIGPGLANAKYKVVVTLRDNSTGADMTGTFGDFVITDGHGEKFISESDTFTLSELDPNSRIGLTLLVYDDSPIKDSGYIEATIGNYTGISYETPFENSTVTFTKNYTANYGFIEFSKFITGIDKTDVDSYINKTSFVISNANKVVKRFSGSEMTKTDLGDTGVRFDYPKFRLPIGNYTIEEVITTDKTDRYELESRDFVIDNARGSYIGPVTFSVYKANNQGSGSGDGSSTQTNSSRLEIINNYKKNDASIIIKKNVLLNGTSDTSSMGDDVSTHKFPVTISFAAGSSAADGTYGDIKVEGGSIKPVSGSGFTVSKSDPIVITGLPAGTSLKVSEQEAGYKNAFSGYTFNAQNSVTELNVTSPNSSEDSVVYTLNNDYKVPTRTVQLSVVQTVSKKDFNEAKENTYVRIKKKDGDGGTVFSKALSDAAFSVADNDDRMFEVTLELPLGSYTVDEMFMPQSGNISLSANNVDVNFDYRYVGTLGNQGKTFELSSDDYAYPIVIGNNFKVKYNKKVAVVDANNPDQLVAGAELKMYDQNPRIDDETTLNKSWESNSSSPEVIEDIGVGSHFITVEAPEGYNDYPHAEVWFSVYTSDGSLNIHGTYQGVSVSGDTLFISVYPYEKFSFKKMGYIKEDFTDNPDEVAGLKGVKYKAVKLKDDGTAATETYTATSDENGNVTFDGLPDGKYSITETATVGNYIVDENVYYTSINSMDNKSSVLYSDKELTTAVPNNTLYNDIPRADFSISKVSEDDTSKKLAGSTYGLYRKNSSGEEILVAEKTTDSDGSISFSGAFVETEYTLKELKAPAGFYVSKNTVSFKLDKDTSEIELLSNGNGTAVLDENGNITWLEPVITVDFSKYDEAGDFLPGAVVKVVDSEGYDVLDEDGAVITWTTGGDVHRVTGTFKNGETYKFIEVSSPAGYELAEDVDFTIPDEPVAPNNSKPVEVKMVNKKIEEKAQPEEDIEPTEEEENSSEVEPTAVINPTEETEPSEESDIKNAGVKKDEPKKDSPLKKTGDDMPFMYVVIILEISILGIILTMTFRRKRY